MSHAYRSAYEHMVGAKLAERQTALSIAAPWLGKLVEIHRARIARAAAGAVGIMGMVATVVASAAGPEELPTVILLGSVVGMISTWLVSHAVLRFVARAPRPAELAAPPLTGDLKADLARLAESPLNALRVQLEASEERGLDLFAIAICLLAPLTLHALFAFLVGNGDLESFSSWIRISLVIVGHAHIALAILTTRFVRRLRQPLETGRVFSVHREWAAAFAWTIVVTCLPGILLLGVPPLLSAVTGIAFIPFLFLYLHGRYHGERAIVNLASAAAVPATEIRIAESLHAFDTKALAPPPVPAEEVGEEPELRRARSA